MHLSLFQKQKAFWLELLQTKISSDPGLGIDRHSGSPVDFAIKCWKYIKTGYKDWAKRCKKDEWHYQQIKYPLHAWWHKWIVGLYNFFSQAAHPTLLLPFWLRILFGTSKMILWSALRPMMTISHAAGSPSKSAMRLPSPNSGAFSRMITHILTTMSCRTRKLFRTAVLLLPLADCQAQCKA